MKDSVCLFVFRRDLRVVDNTALREVSLTYPEVPILPIFIFNPDQVDSNKNKYFSSFAFEFMIESLHDLYKELGDALQYFHGDDIDVLQGIMKHVRVECIAFNKDFTPFAQYRDSRWSSFCQSHNIPLIVKHDYTIFDFDVKTDTGKHYEVFTPFYRKCLSRLVGLQNTGMVFEKNKLNIYTSQKLPGRVKTINTFLAEYSPQKALSGGRQSALLILQKIKDKVYVNYDKERDFPSLDKTTKLSSYLKFGCVSIREVLQLCIKTYGLNHGLVRELIWREFYANITWYVPHVLSGQIQGNKTKTRQNQSMKEKYDKLSWANNTKHFEAWTNGKTGFPIVDAAMNCMNKTGYMHNRLRMIVASFLTKDLMIDWRLGERYFSSKLIDYDPSSNSGGWQWAGSVGADAQPYFRIFNPWLQSEKFDKDCVFIKKWIPSLALVPIKEIHRWYLYHDKYPKINYPYPIVDHRQASKDAIAMWGAVSS